MADRPKISGTLLFRLIGVALIIFFKSVFLGILLVVFARRLSTALGMDEKLAKLRFAVRSRPWKSKSARKLKPKAASQNDQLAPCPYCGRDIKPNTRKCPHCNHTL